eukprot:scaffold9574_cov175-Amphora_coffeaeformis.AAC.1
MLRGVRNFSKEHFTKFFLPQQRGINEALDLSIEEHMSEIEVVGNGNSISDAESQKKPPATKKAPPKATEVMQQIDWHSTVQSCMSDPQFITWCKESKVNCPLAFSAIAQSVAQKVFPKKVEGGKEVLTERAQEKLGYLSQYFDASTISIGCNRYKCSKCGR